MKSGRWYGVYHVDVLQTDGTFRREQNSGNLSDWCVSNRNVPRGKHSNRISDQVNAAAAKLPPKSGLTLAEYVEEWRRDVAVNLKGSTARAAESHLRAHIIPKLGQSAVDGDCDKIRARFC